MSFNKSLKDYEIYKETNFLVKKADGLKNQIGQYQKLYNKMVSQTSISISQFSGFDESCVDLSFKGDLMIPKATVPEYLRQKVRDGNRPFVRDIDRCEYPVPADRYDQASVKAVLKNGFLTVTIPAREEDPSEPIKVNIVKEGN